MVGCGIAIVTSWRQFRVKHLTFKSGLTFVHPLIVERFAVEWSLHLRVGASGRILHDEHLEHLHSFDCVIIGDVFECALSSPRPSSFVKTGNTGPHPTSHHSWPPYIHPFLDRRCRNKSDWS